MKFGLFAVKWNTVTGSDVIYGFPGGTELPKNILDKIMIGHALTDAEKKFVRFGVDDYNIFSYISGKGGKYAAVILYLRSENSSDEEEIEYLADYFEKIGDKLLEAAKARKRNVFYSYASALFMKKNVLKMVMLGPPASGKSSIISAVFGGESPDKLISKPKEPTIGFSHSSFGYLHTEISMVDTSGQELDKYLGDMPESEMIFSDTDIIIFTFDITEWEGKSEEIMEIYEKIIERIEENNRVKQPAVYVFCHKTDLIAPDPGSALLGEFKSAREIIDTFDIKFGERPPDGIFFTSIKKGYLTDLMGIFRRIINSRSELAALLEDEINGLLESHDNTVVILMNGNNVPLGIFGNTGNNFRAVFSFMELINLSGRIFKEMGGTDLGFMYISGTGDLGAVVKKIEDIHPDLDKIAVISTGGDSIGLIGLAERIGSEIRALIKLFMGISGPILFDGEIKRDPSNGPIRNQLKPN